MNNPLFNMNTQKPGTIAASVTTPNKLNKKRKFAGGTGNILNYVNSINRVGISPIEKVGVQPNRAVTDAQPINAPLVQAQQMQPQQAQPQQQNTQTNLPFGGVSQLQASPQAFMSFLRQFNTR